MKRGVAVFRKLSPTHERQLTRVMLIIPQMETHELALEQFVRMAINKTSIWFCGMFPEFHHAEWSHEIVDVDERFGHWLQEDGVTPDELLTTTANLAVRFHEAYHALAPSLGYEPQAELQKFDPTSLHAQLLLKVFHRLLQDDHYPPPVRTAKHQWWGAGDPDCPPEIKAPNGELHTLRCRICGQDEWSSHCPGKAS